MTDFVDGAIIVGAGPVGLVTALKLAQAGIPVLVLESGAAINSAPRAIVYHSPTVAALDRLGVLDDMLELGVLKQETEWRSVDRKLLARMDLSKLRPEDTPYPYNLHLGQCELAGVVLKHLLRLPNTEVRWNHKVVDVAQTSDRVTVGVEADGERQELRARWVVGADGAGSAVRRAIGLGFEGDTAPEWFVATDIRYDFEAHGYARATFIVDPVHWAVIPIIDKHGLFRLTYGEPGEIPREALRERVAAKYRVLLPTEELVEPVAFSPYRVHDRCAETFRVGRVLLAGDAAHAVNPIGGLGLTGGLLDADALGDALVATITGQTSDEVLDHYAAERKRVFVEVVSPAARENKRRLSESDPVCRVADAQRFKRMNEDPEFLRQTMLFTSKLVGNPILPPSARNVVARSRAAETMRSQSA